MLDRLLAVLLALVCFGTVPVRAAGRVTCDGADATAAINAALRGGGAVQLSAGTCLISSSLNVSSDTVLKGAGIGATALRPTGIPDYAMIAVGGPSEAEGASNVDISGLSIDGGNPVSKGINHTSAILARWSSHGIRIHDVEAFAAGSAGIEVRGSDVTVEHNQVHDNEGNGIYVSGQANPDPNGTKPASNVRIIGNTVMNNSRGRRPEMKHGWDGIDLDPLASNCLVEGNTVVGNDIIVLEKGMAVASAAGNRVIRNTIRDVTQGGTGIDMAGVQVDFQIIGNTIRNVMGHGITVNGPARNGVVQGNSISGTTKSGIEIRNTGPFAKLGRPTNITVADNTVVATPGQSAITVRHHARDVQIVNNSFSGGGGAEPIDAEGAARGVVTRDNR